MLLLRKKNYPLNYTPHFSWSSGLTLRLTLTRSEQASPPPPPPHFFFFEMSTNQVMSRYLTDHLTTECCQRQENVLYNFQTIEAEC